MRTLTMSDIAQRLTGAMIDSETYEPVPEHGGHGVSVAFYMGARLDEARSAAEGRPIYVDTEYVRKTVRGDPYNAVDRPVRDEDRRAYPALYRDFKATLEADRVSGTPVAMLPGITRSQVLELGHFKIKTVEALAALSDEAAERLGSVAPVREKARRWLATAADAAALDHAKAEADTLRRELEALRAQSAAKPAERKRRARKSAGVETVDGKGAK